VRLNSDFLEKQPSIRYGVIRMEYCPLTEWENTQKKEREKVEDIGGFDFEIW
jgi:hypothetical protein